MKTKTQDEMYARIAKHGEDLLALFPEATEKDPVKLCKRLRRIEIKAHKAAEDYCNGGITGERWQSLSAYSLACVRQTLGVPALRSGHLIVNGDPRGYALKIDDEWMRKQGSRLQTDWGGYGIIAPDLSE